MYSIRTRTSEDAEFVQGRVLKPLPLPPKGSALPMSYFACERSSCVLVRREYASRFLKNSARTSTSEGAGLRLFSYWPMIVALRRWARQDLNLHSPISKIGACTFACEHSSWVLARAECFSVNRRIQPGTRGRADLFAKWESNPLFWFSIPTFIQ
jgi:hypothetical protein